ncbi:hypothetical protein DRO33_05810 [Candidatus Bathyarchaeota archaeon]|nr:MAG: hypothetical protein DRO33_05810 [Candidatus Bathyarchaeota archaeon]
MLSLIGSIMAFVSLVLPWWSFSVLFISIGFNLINFITGVTAPGETPAPAPTEAGMASVLIILALVFIVLGGILGLAGSFVSSKAPAAIGGVLIILAPIMFIAALALVSSATGFNMIWGSVTDPTGITYRWGISWGVYTAFIAGILTAVGSSVAVVRF